MVDQIAADRVVAIEQESDFELCPNPVRRGDQHRLAVAGPGQRVEPSEVADVGQDLRPEGRADLAANPAQRLVPGVNINPGRPVRPLPAHRIARSATQYSGQV